MTNTGQWSGRRVTNARRRWIAAIAHGDVRCAKCDLPIDPRQPWHLGHQLARALGGSHDPANLHPEHVRCSTSDGGKLAAALRRTTRTIPTATNRRSWT